MLRLLVVCLALCGGLGAVSHAQPLDPAVAAQADDADGAISKKAQLLRDKRVRPQIRLARVTRPGAATRTPLTLRNLWTHEILPVFREDPAPLTWNRFLRCHHTNQAAAMDQRLLGLLRGAAVRFGAQMIEVVSGFRAPKYNLMLRKKGHQVARDSQHTHGNAIDFRVAGAETRRLRQFVLSRHLGGVGYYPQSQFVHADTGPRRTWTAE